MAKQQRQNKLAKNRNGEVWLEENTAIDDNLLPSAVELEKLKEVDPTIIDWILKRTEIEQDARITFNNDRVRITEYDLKKFHRFNFTALVLAFLLFVIVLGISAIFVYFNLPVQGTIFGGTAITVAIVYFLRVISRSNKK